MGRNVDFVFSQGAKEISFFVVRVFLKLAREEPGRARLHDRSGAGGPWVGPPHRHDELESNLIVRGHARLVAGKQSFELLPHSMVWLFPGQDHFLAEQSADFSMWVVVFRRKFIREWASSPSDILLRRLPLETRVRFLDPADARMLERACEQTADTPDAAPARRSGLAFLLLQGRRCFDQAKDETDFRNVHPAVARAANLLQENPAHESLATLGREAGLSSSRLSRLFREQTGVPLQQFRSRQRLRLFFENFGAGRSRTMMEAAFDAGFRSYVQFYRVFREEMGQGPRDYFGQGE